jgi:peroxiredoxin
MGDVDHLKPGIRLPPIALPATDGSDVSLAALSGCSIIVIYPWTGRPGHPNPPNWDDIPGAHGSTPELEGFRDHHTEIAQARVEIYGLSRQTIDYQREMAARLKLPFRILSDVDGRLTGALRLPTFTTGGVIYLTRVTLVIAEGCIAHTFYPVPDPSRHAAEVLAWIKGQG